MKGYRLNEEDAKVLNDYMNNMERLLVDNGIRLPADKNTIRCKTNLMAIED